MKKFPNSLISKIRYYRKKGASYKQIAKLLKISPATAQKYSKDISTSTVRRATAIKNIRTPRTMTKNLVRILGHCMFDGSVFSTKGNYVIKYTNASKEEVLKFIEDVEKNIQNKTNITCENKG